MRFSRLVITERALLTDVGQALHAAFLGRRDPATVCDTSTFDRERTLGSGAATLYADAEPAAGWVRQAEHGSLFVRRGEHHLRHARGCQSDCDYCYLRAAPGLRPVVVYTDLESSCAELRRLFADSPPGADRFVNAGEFADSLLATPDFDFVMRLVEEMPRMGGRLELRTKAADVEPLLGLAHGGRTTVGMSLSPEGVVARHERRTGSLASRISAAARLQGDGYPVAVKFEPILNTPTWREDYADLVETLRGVVDLERVAHVSVGALRWGEGLGFDRVFSARLGEYRTSAATIAYRDDKVNHTLARNTRMEIYRHIIGLMHRSGYGGPTYVSLESPDVVQEIADEFGSVQAAR